MESVREILRGQKMEALIQANHDLATMRLLLDDLLRFVSHRGFCSQCGAHVHWIRSAHSTDIVPYNKNASLHATTCPGKFPEEHDADNGK